MLILDAGTKSIETVLSGAVSTTQLPFTAHWVDIDLTAVVPTFTPVEFDGATNNTTAVTMIASPAASHQVQAKYLSIYNADSATATVTVRYNDGGTLRIIVKVLLLAGYTLSYVDAHGWVVTDVNGAQQGTGPAGATGPTGATGPAGSQGFATDGEDGADGMAIPGVQGPAGAPGVTGPQGASGVAGLDGQDGDDGQAVPGPVGPTGATGATGPQGPAGFGVDGSDGDDGAPMPGAQGPTGPTGATGPAGPMGLNLDGMDGEDGLMGAPGLFGGVTSIGITIDGAGSAITTGTKGFLYLPRACTIVASTLLSTDAAVTSGSIVVDVWVKAFSGYPPTVANTITASALPTLSSATNAQDKTLTGWTKSIAADSVIAWHVNSATTVTRVTHVLTVQPSP